LKLTTERPYTNPEAAARKLVEIAIGIEPNARPHLLINATFMRQRTEFGTGIKFAIECAWLELHESGT
jgi:hypothetical protein